MRVFPFDRRGIDMLDAAYALFFVAVLAGSALLLWFNLRRDWPSVAAVLRGEMPDAASPPPGAGEAHVSERRQPILQPVTISICRI